MIEIDNFEQLSNLIQFNDKEKDIVLVWVVKRNKDGNTEAKGNNKNRTIKSYHLQSLDQLNSKREEIIKLCQKFNCRAYICVNPKPITNVLFNLQSIVMENLRNQINHGTCMLLKGMLDSAVMKAGTRGDKLWVVDIDYNDPEYVKAVINIVNAARSGFDNNVITTVPTAHGCHLITHPFDMRELEGIDAEVKKEGLTLLYAYLNN